MPRLLQTTRTVARHRNRRLRELEGRHRETLARIRPGGGDALAVLARVERIEAEIDALLRAG